jgi:hypothetical protein
MQFNPGPLRARAALAPVNSGQSQQGENPMLTGGPFRQPPVGPVNDVVPGGPGGFGPPPGMGFQEPGMGFPGMGSPPNPMGGGPVNDFAPPGFSGFGPPPPMQTGFGEKPGFNPNMSVREQFAGVGQKPGLQQPADGEIQRRRQFGRALMARRPTPKLPQQSPTVMPGAPINPLSMY